MRLKFTKMQGLGNDFVVLDAIHQKIKLTATQLRKIADRHFGVGCDQILLVEKPRTKNTDFRYRIFNADGFEVEQCGNGARCFVRFVHEKKLSTKKKLRIETKAGIISPQLEVNGDITVDMGVPLFVSAKIPFVTDSEGLIQSLDIGEKSVAVMVLAMGNPHAVQIVENLDSAPVLREGPLIENHPRFPQRVNAGFMQIINRRHIKLRVYERGAGETLACGTGACAAVVAGICRDLLNHSVTVTTRGGNLKIRWDGNSAPVLMTGPAETVFEGTINL